MTYTKDYPRIVIVGAGFAGLYAAKELRRARGLKTVIDRTNHHLFQPLLYQVATATLSPADIAQPIRAILRGAKNFQIFLSDVEEIDIEGRQVRLSCARTFSYDYLILATGAQHSYFDHPEWEEVAPGLKNLSDAIAIRNRFLRAFEKADQAVDIDEIRALTTFVIVGGGPTGVELAGSMMEIARNTIADEFRNIDPRLSRVILLEAASEILPAYPQQLRVKTVQMLQRIGVEVRTLAKVTAIDAHGVSIGDAKISTRNVLWAAGVRANSLGRQLGVPLDRAGRVKVGPDLSIPSHPEVFVVGDLATVVDAKGQQVPGIAPAAIQMGRYVARQIIREANQGVLAGQLERSSFIYSDKGKLATIGRASAVAQIGGIRASGWFAWILWLLVHIAFLIGFRNKLMVMISWAWSYLTWGRGARLITESPNDKSSADSRQTA